MSLEENAEQIQERIRELADGKWKTAVRMVDTELICPNPYHAPQKMTDEELKKLAKSIDTQGLQNPLTIRAIGSSRRPLFQLIAGEKRLRACIYANISPVPCVIVDPNPDHLIDTGEIPLPRNYFEEADIIYKIYTENNISEAELAKHLGITSDSLQKKLTIHEFDVTERKIVTLARISADHAARLYKLDPRTKCEVYRAMLNGVHGHSAEDLITSLSESKLQTRIYIKDVRIFYNTIDKAVATMNRSGISVKCSREEKKTFTRITITVPKRS